MLRVREVIVVEGKYDKIRLESVVDGLIIETHNNPKCAWSDGAQCVTPEELKELPLPAPNGKKVAVPYCRTDVTDLDFYYIESAKDLSPGAFGVLEPEPLYSEKFTDYGNGLCIVPALCYDLNGYRLGFGKGYYDRFLSRYSGKTAGLAYSFQIKRSLWHGRFDKAVDVIITDRYIRSCGSRIDKQKPCRK